MVIDLGNDLPEDQLRLVRAKTSLLLEWDDKGAPTYGLGDAFHTCGMPIADATQSLLDFLTEGLHHSSFTVLLDQLLVVSLLLLVPYAALGGAGTLLRTFLSAPLFAAGYLAVLCWRLMYLGLMS